MTLQIVCLHGMNQQQHTAASLHAYWYALLQHHLLTHHPNIHLSAYVFRVPFYANLITKHHIANQFNLGEFTAKSHLHSHRHTFLDFRLFKANPIWQHWYDLSHDYLIKELLQLLDHFPHLDRTLMHHFLIEAYLYLSDTQFIADVHHKINAAISPSQPTLIIAHSLGTVIAYNLLRQHPEYHIQGFISLASPLIFKIIQAKIIHPIQRPACLLGDWLNFYSPHDFLSAFPLAKTPFTFEPMIKNHAIDTTLAHPHQLKHYLQHPLVIANIAKILKNSY